MVAKNLVLLLCFFPTATHQSQATIYCHRIYSNT
nr:MAG TPA: hypothetical protein [Caudoviricetes sp.]